VKPQIITRLGVRFIDRVTGSALKDLAKLVRAEVAGILRAPIDAHPHHTICESMFDLKEENGRAITRWGLVPANATTEPSAIEPIDQRSWILDIDAFCDRPQRLDVEMITEQTRALAERIYAIFRWVVNVEFLRRYGGRV
jgi:uncharacterized protein (TIGR04255 family)